MRHNGIKQYISVYNFFDLASVIMPICTYTSGLVIHRGNTTPDQEREFTIAIAFTVLVMWMELVSHCFIFFIIIIPLFVYFNNHFVILALICPSSFCY